MINVRWTEKDVEGRGHWIRSGTIPEIYRVLLSLHKLFICDSRCSKTISKTEPSGYEARMLPAVLLRTVATYFTCTPTGCNTSSMVTKPCFIQFSQNFSHFITVIVPPFSSRTLFRVECYKYLGSILTNDGRCTCEIKSRIAMAKAAFNKRRHFLLAHWA